MKYPANILEESLKIKVGQDFFPSLDCSNILGRVDFSACVKDDTPTLFDNDFLLWGEAKRGKVKDFYTSFVQLILTVGKERTFDKYLPPVFLCEFDCEQIAFLPYHKVIDVFYQNDFNWNVAPSDHSTKEFQQLYELVKKTLDSNVLVYSYDKDEKVLKEFIKKNFIVGKTEFSKKRITKNNFISVYNRWQESVRDTIAVSWDTLKKNGILDADFFLADAMSSNNMTITQKLQVLLRENHYILDRQKNHLGLFQTTEAGFTDDGIAHARFWLKYERPPKREYQDYIINRRDLLVPQDVRERKGSYFTPRQWVELAQQYLSDVLGENWQDEYYIWDCCAGTGNLLAGLTNKYNIFASTLDKSDVDVIQERIEKGANLLPSHVFQFDFLNDGYSMTKDGYVSCLCSCEKIPEDLREILSDKAKREKLIFFCNWPYAEVSSSGKGKGKKGVNRSLVHDIYKSQLGNAGREIFTQFLIRIVNEVPGCFIGEFSTIKVLCGSAFVDFKRYFSPELKKMFLVPADSFDNVKGKFPIGFKIWDFSKRQNFSKIEADVYDSKGVCLPSKLVESVSKDAYISKWVARWDKNGERKLGFLCGTNGNDFQHNNIVYILNDKMQMANPRGVWITETNILDACIYDAIRHTVAPSWLNDRDQYLCPNNPSYKNEQEFLGDCLVWTLFDNNISYKQGVNHWIPFTEEEVCAPSCFKSSFMSALLKSGYQEVKEGNLYSSEVVRFSLSECANNLLAAGKSLWAYYMSKPDIEVNASFYDIRAYFQGFSTDKDGKQRMNPESTDQHYTELLSILRSEQKKLAEKIVPKIYEYGFLK